MTPMRKKNWGILFGGVLFLALVGTADAAGSVALGPHAGATLSLNSIFTDHMILQRNVPVRIYGSGTINRKTVTVSFKGQTQKTVVRNGVWEVWLDPMKAETKGQVLTVSTHRESLSLRDILVGDIWVLGGQSNMEYPFHQFAKLLPVVHQANDPRIRICYVDWAKKAPSQTGVPQPRLQNPELRFSQWAPCVYPGADANQQALINNFSPAGYFFAVNLLAYTDVPVGLIQASRGATKAQMWVPEGTLERFPELKCYSDEDDPDTSYLYNSVIYPIQKFTVFGVLWYQGESDSQQPKPYADLFPRLVQTWRESWGTELPFIFASLSSYHTDVDSWPYLRESQAQALSLPKTGMIMTYDIGNYGYIHPQDKQAVGYRFFMKARDVAYGENIISSGPVFDRLTLENSNAVIQFENVGAGLRTQTVSMPEDREETAVITMGSNTLAGFTICGADHKFFPAEAEITGADRVTLHCPDVKAPLAVRYGWASFTLANLFNREGFPAEVFRTDDFPVPSYYVSPKKGVPVTENSPVRGEQMDVVKKGGETSVIPVQQGGQNGWRMDDPALSSMYFDVPGTAFSNGAASRVQLTVVYFDEGLGIFNLKYDSSDASVHVNNSPDGVWKVGGRVKLTDTKTWKSCTFDLNDARFSKRCNGHDLRLDQLPQGFTLGNICIRKTI